MCVLLHLHTEFTHKENNMIVKNRIHPEKRADIIKNVPLHLHVFFDQKRVCTFYTGFRCDLISFDSDKQCLVKNQVNKSGQTSSYVNLHLKAIRAAVDTWAKENPNGTKDQLLKTLRKAADKKEKIEVVEKSETIFDAFDEFLIKHPLSEVRKKNFRVIKRAMQRFEIYTKKELTFDSLTFDLLKKFDEFLRNEHKIYLERKDIYTATITTVMPSKTWLSASPSIQQSVSICLLSPAACPRVVVTAAKKPPST